MMAIGFALLCIGSYASYHVKHKAYSRIDEVALLMQLLGIIFICISLTIWFWRNVP